MQKETRRPIKETIWRQYVVVLVAVVDLKGSLGCFFSVLGLFAAGEKRPRENVLMNWKNRKQQ